MQRAARVDARAGRPLCEGVALRVPYAHARTALERHVKVQVGEGLCASKSVLDLELALAGICISCRGVPARGGCMQQ